MAAVRGDGNGRFRRDLATGRGVREGLESTVPAFASAAPDIGFRPETSRSPAWSNRVKPTETV